jgi:hypothetical protein
MEEMKISNPEMDFYPRIPCKKFLYVLSGSV